MPKGLYILSHDGMHRIYGPDEQTEISRLVDIIAAPQTPDDIRANPGLLADVDIIFSGWGGPRMDEAFLAAAPQLRIVFYGAGSISYMVTNAFWERDIAITSANGTNAITVAEFTLAQIILCLRHSYRYAAGIRRDGAYPADRRVLWTMPGTYGSVVGLLSLGLIGRRVREWLKIMPDVRVIAYDPYATPEQAASLNLELCSLDEVFQRADVISVHTPLLPVTRGLITGAHFEMLKPGASFINTARGAIVREAEMIDVLQRRPDLTAVLDVTYPEPPEPGSPLYTLENVILTPHLAGASAIDETRRLGREMIDELKRYLNGEPLRWQITHREIGIRA